MDRFNFLRKASASRWKFTYVFKDEKLAEVRISTYWGVGGG